MAYRVRLSSIPKTFQEKIKHLSYEEICKKFKIDCPVYELPKLKEIYYIAEADIRKKDYFSFNIKHRGYDFYIIEHEGMEDLINVYKKMIGEQYSNLYNEIKNFHETKQCDFDKITSHLYSKNNNWTNEFNYTPVNTNLSSEKLANSNFYEYDIFDLVRIYKTFDWNKNHLIYSGW